MALSRIKNWSIGEILTAADLNAEFNNIIQNALSLISPLTGNLNFNNFQALNMALQASTLGGLPAAGTAGRLARVTDGGVVDNAVMENGSNWRSIFSRNTNIIVVTDPQFGARGNGTTDDTAAIQAAINALTKGIVFFPPGAYRTTSTLSINAARSITLQGVSGEVEKTGAGASIIQHEGTGNALEVFGTNSGPNPPLSPATTNYWSSVRDIAIDGDTTNSNIGIYARDAYGFFVHRVRIRQFGTGVLLEGASRPTFIDVDIMDNRTIGLDVLGWDRLTYLSGVVGNVPIGIRLDGHTSGRIWPNTIYQTTTAAVQLIATTALSEHNDIFVQHMENNTGIAYHVTANAFENRNNTIRGVIQTTIAPATNSPVVLADLGGAGFIRGAHFPWLSALVPNATTIINIGSTVDRTIVGTVIPYTFAGAATDFVTNNGTNTQFSDLYNGLRVGMGQQITRHLSATATLDFPNTVSGGSSDLTIAVTGASIGDSVALGIPNVLVENSNLALGYYAWVSATDVVRVRFWNASGADNNPGSNTFRVDVWKH